MINAVRDFDAFWWKGKFYWKGFIFSRTDHIIQACNYDPMSLYWEYNDTGLSR
jgi:hypothetical protein